MFACFLLGGMGLAIAVGLLDVFAVHLDAIKTQNHSSGGLDLALGIPLLAAGSCWRPATCTSSGGTPSIAEQAAIEAGKLGTTGFARAPVRARGHRRPGGGIPGASYLLALHHLVASKPPTAIAVVSVLVFVAINFAPVIVPFAFLRVHPRRTEKAITRFKDWIVSHDDRSRPPSPCARARTW